MIKVKFGVDITRIDAVMRPVISAAPSAFARFGYDCWMTSGFREYDPKLHGRGQALDFDSSRGIPEETGYKIRDFVKTRVGPDFDIIWHRVKKPNRTFGAWHLHTEYDPKD